MEKIKNNEIEYVAQKIVHETLSDYIPNGSHDKYYSIFISYDGDIDELFMKWGVAWNGGSCPDSHRARVDGYSGIEMRMQEDAWSEYWAMCYDDTKAKRHEYARAIIDKYNWEVEQYNHCKALVEY